MTSPRVVLEINGLISALIFSRGRFAWLRSAWQVNHFISSGSRDTVTELLFVLSDPKFELGRDEQESLLAEFLPCVETVKVKPRRWRLTAAYRLRILEEADSLQNSAT